MLKDNLFNAEKYHDLFLGAKEAFEFLQTQNLMDMTPQKCTIDGENIYCNLDEYKTRVSDELEAHKKYIDIQYMLKGQEKIGYANINDLQIVKAYNEEKDIAFYKGSYKADILHEGEFMIFYPQDAHLPCQLIDKAENVKKAVVKIRIK